MNHPKRSAKLTSERSFGNGGPLVEPSRRGPRAHVALQSAAPEVPTVGSGLTLPASLVHLYAGAADSLPQLLCFVLP
jgi:hypothetical protein